MKASPPFLRLYENMEVAENGCWNWTGQVGSSGYGQIKAFGKMVSCHRLSFELYKGPIQIGHEVCHSCDNPRCINPDHLFSGTHRQNMEDMVGKGRRIQGRSNPRKGASNSKAIRVLVLGKPYGSIKEAEVAIGVAYGSVRYWLKTGNPKASVISHDEYLRIKNGE